MADSSSDESGMQKPTKASKGKYSSEEEDDKTGATQPVVDDEDSDDDDEPPRPVAKAKAKSAAAKPAQAIDEDSDDDSDDEPPPKAKVKVGATVAKVTQAADEDSDDDSDDEPPPKAKAKAKAAVAKPAQAIDEDSDDDSDDEPPPKAKAKAKAAVAKPAQSDDEDSDDDEPPPVGNAPVKASTPKLAERSAVDDEDSSDDEDVVSRPVAKANAQAATAKPAKAEDKDSDDDEREEANQQKPRTLKVSGLPKKNVEVVKRAVDAAFSECGKVQSVQVISRGVALVTLESHKHLDKALTLNGNTEKVKGSTLQVEIDKGRPKPDKTKLDGIRLGKGASEPAKTSGGEQSKNTAELKLHLTKAKPDSKAAAADALEIGSEKHTHLKLMQLKVLQMLAVAEKPFDFWKVVKQASALAKFADEATKHRPKKSEPNKSEPNKSEDRDLDLQVKVTNIAFAAKASEVKQFFVDRCGEADVHIRTGQDGRTKGFARIQLHDTGAVQKALACDGAEFCGRPIHVQLASQIPSRKERKAISREAVEGTPAKKKARVEMEDAGEKAPDQKKKEVRADASSEAPTKRKETVVSADAASEAPAKKKAKLVREEVASAAPAKLKEKAQEKKKKKEKKNSV